MSKREKIVRCTDCGFRFAVSYARVFACGECPSIIHCDMVKCPECGHEFTVMGEQGAMLKSPP